MKQTYDKCPYTPGGVIGLSRCTEEISCILPYQQSGKCRDCDSPGRACVACVEQGEKQPGVMGECGANRKLRLCAHHAKEGREVQRPPVEEEPKIIPIRVTESAPDKWRGRGRLTTEEKMKALEEAVEGVRRVKHDYTNQEIAWQLATLLPGFHTTAAYLFICGLDENVKRSLGLRVSPNKKRLYSSRS